MKASQNRLQQKATTHPTPKNIHNLLKCVCIDQDVSQPNSNYLNYVRINSFLQALLIAKKTIFSQSVTKNVHCLPLTTEAVRLMSHLDGNQIKGSILKNMCNYVQEFKRQGKLLRESIPLSISPQTEVNSFKSEDVGRLTKGLHFFLLELMQDVQNYLKTQFKSKAIYEHISFKWSAQFVRTFILAFNGQNKNGVQLQKSVQKLDLEVNNLTRCTSTSVDYDGMTMDELLKYISNKNIVRSFQGRFTKLNNELAKKEKQCEQLEVYSKQCAQIIKAQMSLISSQEQEKQDLQQKLMLSQQQLKSLNNKCESIQRKLQRMNQQIANLKQQPSNQSTGYYMNPLWQKQQLQQKYYVEIIQLQSDLLIEKEQNQILINIVLQQIKLSHQFFNDLKASKYTLYRFDHEMLRLMRSTPAFDRVNLEEHLNVRQESLISQSSPSMYKSTISTYSEVDTESKMRSEREIMPFEQSIQEFRQQ